jgi:hypothetical protein
MEINFYSVDVTTNKLFCFWLQGYFEIGNNVNFQRDIVLLIRGRLDLIEEPLGPFTSWLKDVCIYIETLNYSDEICAHFSSIIKRSLHSVFYHVIDNSYTTEKSKEELQRIHDGEPYD